MNNNWSVTKRDGRKEPLNVEKYHRVIGWAGEGVEDFSLSEVAVSALKKMFDGITTKGVTTNVIETMVELITADTPGYSIAAARALAFDIRKDVYGQVEPWSWLDQVNRCVKAGIYDPVMREAYTDDELNEIGSVINHAADFEFVYGGIAQLAAKYLLKNRVTGETYESPQMAYMRIPVAIFSGVADKAERLQLIKDFYVESSEAYFSQPTPIMSGAGTLTRQFSSCVGIKAGDSLESIAEAGTNIIRYASRKAGIGIDGSAIRPINSPIRGGAAKHTGVLPFIKKFKGDLKSCAQGGIRGASATYYYQMWHMEFETLIVLKNPKGTEESRERRLDYGVVTNGFLWERYLSGKSITLFDPSEVPDLYKAFYGDQAEFARLYEYYEKKRGIRRKKLKAEKIFSMFANDRSDTGRIYVMFADNANQQGPFDPSTDPIYMSNLCVEILLPNSDVQPPVGYYAKLMIEICGGLNTFHEDVGHDIINLLPEALKTKINEAAKYAPYLINDSAVDAESLSEYVGRIFLCTLASVNLGKFDKPTDMEKTCRTLVRFLCELLRFQDYPVLQARLSTEDFAPLGIGIINLAYFFAKRGMKYGEPDALQEIKTYMEHINFYLMQANVEMAKLYGPCKKWKTLCYAKGIFPWEKRRKEVDELADFTPSPGLDWEGLRRDMQIYGVAHATLIAIAPTETSAQIMGATNGIEPPFDLVSDKGSKDGAMKHVVPEVKRLRDQYETKWGMKGCLPYLKTAAVIQVYACQSLSTNTYYNPFQYPNGKVPLKVALGDMYMFYRWGGKTLYYNNVFDGKDENDKDVQDQDICEACVI